MSTLPDKSRCVGCTACVFSCPQKCIKYNKDKLGFGYPIVDHSKCIHCKRCESSCPVLKTTINEDKITSSYAVKIKDDEIRNCSSSGGVFTELASYILKNSGEVYGAAYSRDFEVVHIRVDDAKHLEQLRGAKYAQSELGDTFLDIKDSLIKGNHVLFVGTPCQVAGLKSFLKKDYSNLVCIDFICHGVPSPVIWDAYLKFIERKYLSNNKIDFINMRDKSSGWSNYTYSHLFKSSNEKKYISNKESLFMKLFIENSINRDSCSECKFKGYDRVSDITLGDFWGIWDIAPEFDDNKGVSAVLIHTQKGQQLFNACLKNIDFISVKKEDISFQNPSLLDPSKENTNKADVMRVIQTKGFDALVYKKGFLARIKRKVKNIIKLLS